ncbi:MAG: PEFG-CTERM sorting domain-containing protein [Nitrosotalea sp.]
MNSKFNGLVLLAVLLGSIAAVPAFAASNSTNSTNSTMGSNSSMTMTPSTTVPANLPPPSYMFNANSSMGTPSSGSLAVTVTTDKSSYNDGDKILVSGTTKDYLGDTPLTLELRSPLGNIVKIDQVTVGTDKTFSDTVTATGALWQSAGTYSIYVQYGGTERSATTTFQFAGSVVSSGPSTIPVDGTSYALTYTITNGKVIDIKADPQSKSLTVTIQTTGDGLLTITMPRALIDAKKSDGTDDVFVVLNDGQQNAQANETLTTNTDRTLAIPFKNGTQQIEIIGTFVIPEFGPIAALVLTIAIISIIAISSKTGLRLLPKY